MVFHYQIENPRFVLFSGDSLDSPRRNEDENRLFRFRSEDHHGRLILMLWNESVFFWKRLGPSCLYLIILSVQNLFNTKEFFVGKRPCARIRLERAAKNGRDIVRASSFFKQP